MQIHWRKMAKNRIWIEYGWAVCIKFTPNSGRKVSIFFYMALANSSHITRSKAINLRTFLCKYKTIFLSVKMSNKTDRNISKEIFYQFQRFKLHHHPLKKILFSIPNKVMRIFVSALAFCVEIFSFLTDVLNITVGYI